MQYVYRQLTSSDAHLMKRMLEMFAEAFEDLTTYQGAVPDDSYLSALLTKPHVIALAATMQEDVIGGLVAYVLDKFEQNRREIYIYDLAVVERHRRRGVATALIGALVHLARERDAYAIFVQADRGDEPAVRLYESLGRRTDVYHFDIQLTGRAT